MNRNAGPALIVSVLSILSFWIVREGAQNEPYVDWTAYDAFTQIGVAGALIAGWIFFAIGLVARIRRRQLAAPWAAVLAWILVALFYLQASPRGFWSDLARFRGLE